MQDIQVIYEKLLNKYVQMGYDETKFFEDFPHAHFKMLEYLYDVADKSEVEEALEYGCLEEIIPSSLLVDVHNLEEKYKLFVKLRSEIETTNTSPTNSQTQVIQSQIATIVEDDGLSFEENEGLDFEDDGLSFEENEGLSFEEEESDFKEQPKDPSPIPTSTYEEPKSYVPTSEQVSVQEETHCEPTEIKENPQPQLKEDVKSTSNAYLDDLDDNVKAILLNIDTKSPKDKEVRGKTGFTKAIAYCVSCTHSIASNKSAYLNCTFKDAFGKIIGAKLFNFKGTKDDAKQFLSKICLLSGVWDNYNGNDQLILDSLSTILDTTLENCKLVPDMFMDTNSSIDLKHYAEQILGFIQNVKDADYRKLLDHIFVKHDYLTKYSKVPAGIMYHHVGKGHLLQHVCEVAQCCAGLASVHSYINFNMSLCIAGALLHDIGKVIEMPQDGTLTYTHQGVQCGHIVLGTSIVTTMANEINLPQDKLINLLSLIATHHGSSDKGSPVSANSPDAMLVHMADECSAQLNHIWLKTVDLKPNEDILFARGMNYIRLS